MSELILPDGPIMKEIQKGPLKLIRGTTSTWRKKQELNKYIQANYFIQRPKRYPKPPSYNYGNVNEEEVKKKK